MTDIPCEFYLKISTGRLCSRYIECLVHMTHNKGYSCGSWKCHSDSLVRSTNADCYHWRYFSHLRSTHTKLYQFQTFDTKWYVCSLVSIWTGKVTGSTTGSQRCGRCWKCILFIYKYSRTCLRVCDREREKERDTSSVFHLVPEQKHHSKLYKGKEKISWPTTK